MSLWAQLACLLALSVVHITVSAHLDERRRRMDAERYERFLADAERRRTP